MSRVLWKKRKTKEKKNSKKRSVHSIHILNFYLSKFSFSSFSSSSITIVSLISQRPTAQKDFLLYIRSSIISSSSSIPSFSSYIFYCKLNMRLAKFLWIDHESTPSAAAFACEFMDVFAMSTCKASSLFL